MTDTTEGPTGNENDVAARLVLAAHELRDRAEQCVEDAYLLLDVEIEGSRVLFDSEPVGTWQQFYASEDPAEFYEYIRGNPGSADTVKVKPRFDPDLSHLCESPIETMFYDACAVYAVANDPSFVITPQVDSKPPAGPHYRLDFASEEYRLCIELDGHDYHKTKEQRTADAQRDRELHRRGWNVLRFTGSEVFADAAACASETYGVFMNLQIEAPDAEEKA